MNFFAGKFLLKLRNGRAGKGTKESKNQAASETPQRASYHGSAFSSLHTATQTTTVDLVRQATSGRIQAAVSFDRRRVEGEKNNNMLKQQFSSFLPRGCMREGATVGGEWERAEGMILVSQVKVSRSRNSQRRHLVAWSECGREGCMLPLLLFPQPTRSDI